jgi:hypothetical protein
MASIVMTRELLELYDQVERLKKASLLEKAAAAEASLRALLAWATAIEGRIKGLENGNDRRGTVHHL